MLRILLADDHDVLRRGLRHLIEEQAGWEVCAEAIDGREAVEIAKKEQPDVAIVDISMPGLNGLEATRQIKKAVPRIEVLIFTMHEDERTSSSGCWTDPDATAPPPYAIAVVSHMNELNGFLPLEPTKRAKVPLSGFRCVR